MPILGLTQQQPALRIAGVLKKGSEKSEKRPGADLKDLFRFEGRGNPRQRQAIERAFAKHYPQPNQIRCQLVYALPSDNFDANMELYGSGNWLKAQCNGQEIYNWYDGEAYSNEPRPCQMERNGTCKLGCQRTGRLLFWVPELFREGFTNPIALLVHGKNDIALLDQELAYWGTLTDDIRGITFMLQRQEAPIKRPAFDKTGNRTANRGKMDAWLVELKPPISWLELRLAEIALDNEPALVEPLPDIPQGNGKLTSVVHLEETPVEQRLAAICQKTGCPWKTIQAIARSRWQKSTARLTEDDGIRIRTEVFLQWAEMQYGLDRELSQLLFADFWRNSDTSQDDGSLFDAWRMYCQAQKFQQNNT